jgi:hypothetical protein
MMPTTTPSGCKWLTHEATMGESGGGKKIKFPQPSWMVDGWQGLTKMD